MDTDREPRRSQLMAWDEIAEIEDITVHDLLAMNPEPKNRLDTRERTHAYEVYIAKLRRARKYFPACTSSPSGGRPEQPITSRASFHSTA